QMTYADAMKNYGSDKPDIRFEMTIQDLTFSLKGSEFAVLEQAPYIGGIVAKSCAAYSRKDIDTLTEWVKRPQIGAKGLIYIKHNDDGTIKSSIDKFFSPEQLRTV